MRRRILKVKDIVPKPIVIVMIIYIIVFVSVINYELKNNPKFRSTFVCEKNNTFSIENNSDLSLYFYDDVPEEIKQKEKEEQIKCNETLKKLSESGQKLLYIEMGYILVLMFADYIWEKRRIK